MRKLITIAALLLVAATAKGQMSQDHRLLTDKEIVNAFYWYFLKYCKDNRTQKYRLTNGRKLLFEARKARK